MKKLFTLMKKLKTRKNIAIASIVIGAILILFTTNAMHKVKKAKGTANYLSDFFTNSTGIWNPIIKFFGGKVHEAASKYDTTLSLLLVLGIAMVVLGLFDLYWHRKK